MSIEDIDYLIANSEKDSATFFIDSSDRNRRFYRDAQEFTLEFTEPLRNVYGIEILDATIPVTMYNVDTYNSSFAYTRVFYNTGFNATDLQAWFVELQDNTHFNRVFDGAFESGVFVCADPQMYATIVDGMQADTQLVFSPYIAMHRHVIDGAGVQRDDPTAAAAPGRYRFTYNSVLYSVPVANQEALAVVQLGQDFTVLMGANGSLTLVTYDSVFMPQAYAVQLIEAHANGEPRFDVLMMNMYMQLELGNYDGNSMFQYLQSELRTAAQVAISAPLDASSIELSQLTRYGTLAKQFRVRFTLNNVASTLIFDMRKSTSGDIFGFSGFALDTSPRYLRLPHRTNEQLFMSRMVPNPNPEAIDYVPFVQYLEADGIMNLQGLRYILLRVPEIENHLLNSFAYGKYCPGVGMFKLASGNEIAYLRFDFVNLVKKPFHPIGKLPRITLRFEISNGDLYDFKGVDYNLLMVIKYYSPKTAPRPPRSLLNPNYDPDFVAYMNRKARQQVDRQYDVRDVLREQNKYLLDGDGDVYKDE